MAIRNERKKLTIEDKWWKFYTKKSGMRQHRTDKKLASRFMRKYAKKIIKKEVEDL